MNETAVVHKWASVSWVRKWLNNLSHWRFLVVNAVVEGLVMAFSVWTWANHHLSLAYLTGSSLPHRTSPRELELTLSSSSLAEDVITPCSVKFPCYTSAPKTPENMFRFYIWKPCIGGTVSRLVGMAARWGLSLTCFILGMEWSISAASDIADQAQIQFCATLNIWVPFLHGWDRDPVEDPTSGMEGRLFLLIPSFPLKSPLILFWEVPPTLQSRFLGGHEVLQGGRVWEVFPHSFPLGGSTMCAQLWSGDNSKTKLRIPVT